MKLKSFVKQCVPPILVRAIKYIKRKPTVSLPMPIAKPNGMGDKLVIVGNGPSLRETIRKYHNELSKMDCMVVNFFASTDLYETVKPKYYVLSDHAFFGDNSGLQQSVQNLIETLVAKTRWEMTMVIHEAFCNSDLVSKLTNNKHIHFYFWNVDEYKIQGMSPYEAWDKGLRLPPDVNVLNLCVWMAINWGYPESYIVGADSSWILELSVDQNNNKLYTIDKHFYSKEEVYKDADLFIQRQEKRYINNTIYEELSYITASFGAYEELQKYAEWKGVKVYNASEFSLIDSFERKKLDFM